MAFTNGGYTHGRKIVERVEVIQVVNPGNIDVRRIKSNGEFTDFDKLNFDLSAMLSTADAYHPPFEVTINEDYIARISSRGNQFCRVRVEDILSGATQYKVICKLIDYGEQVTVDRHCLRKVHRRYFDLPAQVKSVRLANILPASLHTDMESFRTELRESRDWSPCATQYLKKHVTGRNNVQIEYYKDSPHEVTMYAENYCINKTLVSQQMAVWVNSPAPQEQNKVYTFAESQEMERQLEEEELRQAAALYTQSTGGGDGSTRPQLHRSPMRLSNDAGEKLSMGRGKSLLDALSNNEAAESTLRMPSTLSIAQTCSPPRPTTNSKSSVSCSALSDLTNQLSISNGTDSGGSTERNGVLNKKTGRLTFPAVTNQSSGDPTNYQPLQNGVHTVLSNGDGGRARKSVSFHNTDELNELALRDKLVLSSGCDSGDDTLYQPSLEEQEPTTMVYQKRLKVDESYPDHGSSREFQANAISYSQSQANALKRQVTVFSDVPVVPAFSIHNSRLHDRSIWHWKSLGGSETHPLRTIQAYTWPVLIRGRELVAITDPFYMEDKDGVSLTYVLALATLLLDDANYQCLPDGNGPRCLILCASWSKARQIFFHVSSIFGDKADKCLLVLHGRRESENSLNCQLVNGTDVIVSTPSTFMRMLESGYTNVLRLCHLVVDDADIITKEFPSQLSSIMKEIATAVNKNVERAAPRQLALFANSWTPLIGVFREEFMTAAATVITNKIEAAVASNVKQVVHYIDNEQQRLSTMLKLVDMSGCPALRLVVCVRLESDAQKVYEALQAYSREVYLAMKSLRDVDCAMELWSQVRSENSYPILVITDEVLQMLLQEGNPVVNAHYVLHYNMPNNKKDLGLRLHCLSSHYAENAENLMLASHIIFSAKDSEAATTIVRIMRNTGCEIPEEVRQLSVKAIERNESGKKKELCHYMKSYGKCRDQLKCTARHLISVHLDTPSKTIPTSGDVEFKVVYVKDAATCYARLIRHRDVNGVLHHIQSNKFNLDLRLQAYFSQPHVKICMDPAKLENDKLCVYEKDGIYYRTRIIKVLPDIHSVYIPNAYVHLLDDSKMLTVRTTDLYDLPESCDLESFPLELVEVIACKLKPMDHDTDWSGEVNAQMRHLLQGEIVCGKIQLCLGNTLWCDPIVKREYLKDSKMWVSLWYANLKLLGDVNTGTLATKNPEHIELLKEACKGKITLPKQDVKAEKASRPNQLIPNELIASAPEDIVVVGTSQLDEMEPTHVYLSIVEDPSLLFVIRTDQHDRLQAMEDDLQEVLKRKGKLKVKNAVLKNLCVAKYPDDGRWCRCVIMSYTSGKFQLLAIDYGRVFQESEDDVSAIPPSLPELTELPYQAIECHMPTVMPIGAEWLEASGDLIWNHCGQSVSLYAKVVNKKPAKFIGDSSYGIELIDTTTESDVYISHLLISNEQAIERKLDLLQQLDVQFDAEQLEYPYQQIPKLIRVLNRTDEHNKRLLIAQYIHQLVQQSSNLKHEMRRQGIVKSLCSLVNTVNLHDDLLYHIIECLTILTTNNLDNCEELWWEKGFSYLYELVEICDDNGILTKALTCLKNLINSSSIKQEADTLELFTINLVHICRVSIIIQNRMLALDILNIYVQGEAKRAAMLMKQDIVKVLTDMLDLNNDSLMEKNCLLMNSIISINGKQDGMEPWTTTVSLLAARMFKITTDSTLLSCAKTLYTMLKNLNGATAMLKSTQLHDKMQRLVNSGLNAQTREMCVNLLIKVKPDVSASSEFTPDVAVTSSCRPKTTRGARARQKILIQPINRDNPNPIREKKVPQVLWWECSQFLMLQVQVHDARTLDPIPTLNYKQEKLVFQCGEYEFSLGPIYDRIEGKKSARETRSSEIKYALYKKTPKLWTRLMAPGYKKPSFVRPNMDLMVTSSDDESYIDYKLSPFLIKPRPQLKYSTFESIKGPSKPLCDNHLPAEEYISTSEEEKEEEDDDRYDTTYNTRYDFFNI